MLVAFHFSGPVTALDMVCVCDDKNETTVELVKLILSVLSSFILIMAAGGTAIIFYR